MTDKSNEALPTGGKKKPGWKTPELQDVVIQAKIIGRNRVPVVPEDVRKLAALGCNKVEICNFLGICTEALDTHFSDELTLGREEVKQKLRRAMLENAIVKMQPAIQIFLAKNLLNMSDTGEVGDSDKILPWESAK